MNTSFKKIICDCIDGFIPRGPKLLDLESYEVLFSSSQNKKIRRKEGVSNKTI